MDDRSEKISEAKVTKDVTMSVKMVDGSTFEQLFPLPRKLLEVDQDDQEGQGMFYFHEPGDFLTGKLIGTRKRKTLHYEFKTYLMKAYQGRQDGRELILNGDGQIVEFPGNLKLRRILEDHELLGSRLRIVFKGKRGRFKKYDVFKDKGTYYESEEQKHG